MIEYRFYFGQDTEFRFTVDETTDTGAEAERQDFPEWMLLENHRCGHCRIPPGARKTCPAALSVEPMLQVLSGRLSYEPIRVEVLRQEFKIEAVTTAQRGARSLMGLLMALSSCPTMMKLRPMAYFHLPFGSGEQTLFRALGMYFIGQYLRSLEGLDHSWDLEGLVRLYEEIHDANVQVADRIRDACELDAAVNSLILLDSLGLRIETSIEDNLHRLKPIFSVYLEE